MTPEDNIKAIVDQMVSDEYGYIWDYHDLYDIVLDVLTIAADVLGDPRPSERVKQVPCQGPS